MRILVTGGSGFVGRNLTKQLVKDHDVVVVSTGSEPKIPDVKYTLYMGLEGINWRYVSGQDVLIHLMANNDTLCQNQEEMLRANLYGPIRLFTHAYEGGCRKFIYASSTAVYGDSPAPYIENKTPIKPLNLYADSKARFDEFAMRFAKTHDVSVIGLRYCNIYGPGEEEKGPRMSMIGQIMRKSLALKQVKLFEFGEQKRDWVYIDDVVQANLKALNNNESFICNIGSGKAHSFNAILDIINERIKPCKVDVEFVKCPFENAYQNYTECNIELAKLLLGYVPEFNLEQGITAYFKSITSYAS